MNLKHDVVALINARAGGGGNATAGGTGDNTEIDGTYVDRSGFGSAKLIIHYRATLAAAATLSIAANAQDATSDAGAGVADFGTAYPATVVATGPGGGGTVRGTIELDFSLQAARQFLRSQVTPNLSASGTDTCTIESIWVFGGKSRNPASSRVNA